MPKPWLCLLVDVALCWLELHPHEFLALLRCLSREKLTRRPVCYERTGRGDLGRIAIVRNLLTRLLYTETRVHVDHRG